MRRDSQATIPKQVLEALEAKNWYRAVTLAIRFGIRDEEALIDLVDDRLNSRSRRRGGPRSIEKMRVERKEIRTSTVRPLLHAVPAVDLSDRTVLCGARGLAQPKPEPGPAMTGVYEHRKSGIGLARFAINQAGNRVELVASDRPKVGSRSPRRAVRFSGGLQRDGSYLLSDSQGVNWFRLGQSSGVNAVYTEHESASGRITRQAFARVSNGATIMEAGMAQLTADGLRGPNDRFTLGALIAQDQWNGLYSDQITHLKTHLSEAAIVPLLADFYSETISDSVAARTRQKRSLDDLNVHISGKAFDSQFWHYSDLPLAYEVGKYILANQNWDHQVVKNLSLLDWCARALGIVCTLPRLPSLSPMPRQALEFDGLANMLGLPCTTQANWKSEDTYTYKFKFYISGVSGSILVLVGAFYGDLTIEEHFKGRRTNSWKYDFAFAQLGAGPKASLNLQIGGTLEGTGHSFSRWQSNEFIGPLSGLSSSVSAGVGLSLDASAKFLHVHGSGLTPMMPLLDASVGTKKGTGIGADFTGTYGRIYAPNRLNADPPQNRPDNDYTIKHDHEFEVHFCLDSAQLTPPGRQLVRIMCANELAALTAYGTTTLRIIGHTDTSRPRQDKTDEAYNKKLSQDRADNVMQAISDVLGSGWDQRRLSNLTVRGEGEKKALEEGSPTLEPNPKYRLVQVDLDGRLVLTLRAA